MLFIKETWWVGRQRPDLWSPDHSKDRQGRETAVVPSCFSDSEGLQCVPGAEIDSLPGEQGTS